MTMKELSHKKQVRESVLIAFLIVVVIVQCWIVINGYASHLQSRIRTVENLPAIERSAYLSFGDEFAGYISFLLGVTPESARIVVPPSSIDSTYGNQGIMQYFLFHREIVNCPEVNVVEECLELFRGKSTFILYVGGFPNQDLVGDRELIVHKDGFGVFTPYQSVD